MQTASQDRITLVTEDRSGPAIPEHFLRQLKSYDPTLLVRWNPRKMRFVVQQCIAHHAPTSEHNHLCATSYVLLVQDPEGGMMPLGDAVMNQIKARDVSRAGYGPEDLQKFLAMGNRLEEQDTAERKRKSDEAVELCSRDNRRQLLRAFRMLDRMGKPNR